MCGVRSAVEYLISTFKPGSGIFYFVSSLGNGKSIALAEARYGLYSKGYDVLTLSNRGDTLKEELHNALQGTKHKIIFIDNYIEWMDVLPIFRGYIGADLSLVLSARSASHDALLQRVQEALAWEKGVELDLDTLRTEELEWVSGFLNTYGLWGDRAGDSVDKKLRFLREDCSASWSSILLAVFEAPQIMDRLKGVFESLQAGFEFRQAIFRFMILTVLGYHPDSPTLITLCGDELLTTSFRNDPAVRELIEFGRDSFSMRSSVVAQFLLHRIVDPNRTVAAHISLIKLADELADGSSYYWEMFKNLVRFSSSHLFFPEESRGRSAMRVYEAIKDFSNCRSNPLFWLQYAIAALVARDYERSGKYFKTAYSHAERLDQYDVFQIDNHYARFLLERASALGIDDPMGVFREARSLLRPQFAQEWRHYPYRVATGYYRFAEALLHSLTTAEKDEIVTTANEILERIAKLPDDRRGHRVVRDCAAAQRKLVSLLSAS